VAVSMSFRMAYQNNPNPFEFPSETQLDSHFTTPSGHNGITFLAASGDYGAWNGPMYPSSSPNVVAVGGTTLSVDQYGNYLGETGWSGNKGSSCSGGGYSAYEREPSYQYRVQNSGLRTTPDVAMDADPNTGCWVYSTAPSTGWGSWQVVGGTSASTPMFAGLIAIADQGRALSGRGSLDGPSQTLPAIYSAQMDGDFHDITSGFNGYYAGPGYDLVTGRGSPIAFNVVRDLMQVSNTGFGFNQVAASSTAHGANLAGGQMVASAFNIAAPTPSSPLQSNPMRTPQAVPAAVIVAPEIALPSPTVLTQVPGKARATHHYDLALDALQRHDFDLSWVA
jgi:subtilase family serine protease